MSGREAMERLVRLCQEIDGRRAPLPRIVTRLAAPVAVPLVLGISPALAACATDERDVEEGCTDGVDNDGDGEIDCADDDCLEETACLAQPTYGVGFESVCSDGLDDDADGSIDCADADCVNDPSCLATPDYAAPFDDHTW
jgi:hypothetical protein